MYLHNSRSYSFLEFKKNIKKIAQKAANKQIQIPSIIWSPYKSQTRFIHVYSTLSPPPNPDSSY